MRRLVLIACLVAVGCGDGPPQSKGKSAKSSTQRKRSSSKSKKSTGKKKSGKFAVLAANHKPTKEDIPELIKAFKSGSQKRQEAVVLRFAKIGDPAFESLVEVFRKQGRFVVRRLAAKQLARFGTKGMEALYTGLEGQDPTLRQCAGEGLRHAGVEGAPYVLRGLKHKSAGVRRAALLAVTSDCEGAVPVLKDIAIKQDVSFKDALNALSKMGAESVPALQEVFTKCEDSAKKGMVLDTFKEIGEPAVPALVELLTGTHAGNRSRALYTLKAMGPKARGAVSALKILANNSKPADFTTVTQVLKEIGEPGVPTLMDIIKAEVTDKALQANSRKTNVSELIATMGPKAASAVPDLIALFLQKSPYAAKPLIGIGEPASKALGELLLRGSATRMRVLKLLVVMGPNAVGAADQLLRVMDDSYDEDSVLALKTIGNLGPAGSRILPALLERMKNSKRPVRIAGAIIKIDVSNTTARNLLFDTLRRPRPKRDRSEKEIPEAQDPRHQAYTALSELDPVALRSIAVHLIPLGFGRRTLERMAAPRAEDARAVSLLFTEKHDKRVYSKASSYLARGDKTVVPVLLSRMKKGNATVRLYCIHALGSIRPHATSAIPALKSALNDTDPIVRQAAERSLDYIDRTWRTKGADRGRSKSRRR